jgi:thiamine phosphate synthase YjbQ (UPF0047 family)
MSNSSLASTPPPRASGPGSRGHSLTVPARDGKLLLSTWQNVFFCDFDGPRREGEVVVTLV